MLWEVLTWLDQTIFPREDPEPSPCLPLDHVPEEVWFLVASYLGSQDLVWFGLVCQQFSRISMDDSLWKSLCSSELGFAFLLEGNLDKTWKKTFKALMGSQGRPSFMPGTSTLGCEHYSRPFKIRTKTHPRWVACNHCKLPGSPAEDRTPTHMMCMGCKTVQSPSQNCQNKACLLGTKYYCAPCGIWDSRMNKYHCEGCGFCRRGIREDYNHCSKCRMCIVREIEHKCFEGQTSLPCPQCNKGLPLRISMEYVTFLQCGHAMHHECNRTRQEKRLDCPLCPSPGQNPQ